MSARREKDSMAVAETCCEVVGRLLARFHHANGRAHREQQYSSGDVSTYSETKQSRTLEPRFAVGWDVWKLITILEHQADSDGEPRSCG